MRSRSLPGCTLARKARTVRTSAIVMSSCWIDQLWQTILRERHASVCIIERVWVLERPKNLPALWNGKVSAFGSILKYCINSVSIGTASSGRVSEVAAIGRCPLRQVPLIMAHLGGLLRERFQCMPRCYLSLGLDRASIKTRPELVLSTDPPSTLQESGNETRPERAWYYDTFRPTWLDLWWLPVF